MPCDSPHYVTNPSFPSASNEEQVPVPCGACPLCQKRRINQWVFRLQQERKDADTCHFITLTYDNDHVPRTPHGFNTLDKTDVQKFMKRLRKMDDSGKKIRYYFCGEYGKTTMRPHYHAIIYDAPESLIDKAWSLGVTDVRNVKSTAAIAYVLKYMVKGKKIPMFAKDDRQPEFALMSKRMGAGYIDNPAIRKWHKADLTRNYVVDLGGHKIPMPRYYRDKIFNEHEKELQGQLIRKEVKILDYRKEIKYEQDRINDPHSIPYIDYKESSRYGRYHSWRKKGSDSRKF